MARDDSRQARELFHSSIRSPRIEPEWHSLFSSSQTPVPSDTYGDMWPSGAYSDNGLRDHIAAPTDDDVPGPEQQFSQTRLAGAKLARGLHSIEHVEINIESNSVYGAAILMPQLARSTGWNAHLTSLAVASYLYLFLCIAVHSSMLMFMDKEERIMDGFAGQMFLCDFGENIERCKAEGGSTECVGPGGTLLNGSRLYSWTQWSTRDFVRDSLEKLFPDLIGMVDPGEYGVESYNCRLVCVILFVISIIPEMELCVDMVRLFWYVPSKSESWIALIDNESGEPRTRQAGYSLFSKDDQSSETETKEGAHEAMEQVRVSVAGIPLAWKAFNVVFVLCPKIVLVFLTAQTGICFLMETAGIDDIIVNSVALGFLLSLDELITDNLMCAGANRLIDMCEGFSLAVEEDDGQMTEKNTMKRYGVSGGCPYWRELWQNLFRTQLLKLFAASFVTVVFVGDYYRTHCDWKDGRYVSKTMHLPKKLSFSMFNAFLPWFFPIEYEPNAVWTMPEAPERIGWQSQTGQ